MIEAEGFQPLFASFSHLRSQAPPRFAVERIKATTAYQIPD